LHRSLDDFPFSCRLTNWASRRNVATLGELVKWTPRALSRERNVGRTSVNEARRVIETSTGRRWEDLIAPEPSVIESGVSDRDRARPR
jgi:DNA-directed RNA polymerase alpha subunit